MPREPLVGVAACWQLIVPHTHLRQRDGEVVVLAPRDVGAAQIGTDCAGPGAGVASPGADVAPFVSARAVGMCDLPTGGALADVWIGR